MGAALNCPQLYHRRSPPAITHAHHPHQLPLPFSTFDHHLVTRSHCRHTRHHRHAQDTAHHHPLCHQPPPRLVQPTIDVAHRRARYYPKMLSRPSLLPPDTRLSLDSMPIASNPPWPPPPSPKLAAMPKISAITHAATTIQHHRACVCPPSSSPLSLPLSSPEPLHSHLQPHARCSVIRIIGYPAPEPLTTSPELTPCPPSSPPLSASTVSSTMAEAKLLSLLSTLHHR